MGITYTKLNNQKLMPNQTHKIPADLKKQIIDRVKQGGVTVVQAAEEHGVSTKTIYNWLSRGATASPDWKDLARLRKENEILLTIIGKLTVDKTVLEKKGTGR